MGRAGRSVGECARMALWAGVLGYLVFKSADFRSLIRAELRLNWSPCCVSREYTFHQFAVANDRNSIHKYESNPVGILQRFVEGCAVDDLFRVEDSDVGVYSHSDSSLIFERGRSLFQTLGRHQRHLAQRGHQVQRFFFSYVMSEHTREGSLSARMNL